MVRITSRRLGLVAVVFAAVACASDPNADAAPSALTLTGLVTQEGAPLPHTTVAVRLWDTTASQMLVDDTVSTDAAGHFEARLELDTLLVGIYHFDAFVAPPFGSGLLG
jgi:5-hydroxyisourate hydrolase-like protein (transthyretin family)